MYLKYLLHPNYTYLLLSDIKIEIVNEREYIRSDCDSGKHFVNHCRGSAMKQWNIVLNEDLF